MLIHVHWKATETYSAIAAPTMLVTDAPVCLQYNFSILSDELKHQ